MKNVKEFLTDLENNTALAAELDKRIASSCCKTSEDALETTVIFAGEKGYCFDAEELALNRAANRPVSDDELNGISGGNDFCLFDYACPMIWNKCQLANECEMGFNCSEALWCAQNLHGADDKP